MTVWYAAIAVSGVAGVLLCLNYGFLGLIAFSILHVIACLFCPESHSKSLNNNTNAELPFMAAFILSLLASLIFWLMFWIFLDVQDVAALIVRWSHLGVVRDDTQLLAAYIIDPSSVTHKNEYTRVIDSSPKELLNLVLLRFFTYLYLPILLSAGALEHIRWARSLDSSIQPPVGFTNKGHFFVFAGIVIICMCTDIAASRPHIVAVENYRGTWASAIFIVFFGPLWVLGIRQSIVLALK